MTSVSSIETSFYPGLIEGFSPKTTERIPAVEADVVQENQGSYSGSGGLDSDVDLSNYYSNIRPEDLLSQTGANVVKTAQDLDNAMVSAIQNGYSVNDACNIKNAELAYKANAYMFKVTNEISTFLLEV